MIILLIGGNGQLGSEFLSFSEKENFNIYSPNSSELDITDHNSTSKFIKKLNPEIILNFAAYTDVNGAESNYKKANNINNIAVKNLAMISNECDAGLIHISTDFVFGKDQKGPYTVNDITSPINQYGVTKDSGEKEILKNCKKSIIIRVASLYGLHKKNFLKNFINTIKKNGEISAIYDQKITLTNSQDLVEFIYLLLNSIKNKSLNEFFNETIIYHYINTGYTTWYDVAKLIVDEMNKNKLSETEYRVKKISKDQWKQEAERPDDSRLVPSHFDIDGFRYIIPEWETSLIRTINNYFKSNINE